MELIAALPSHVPLPQRIQVRHEVADPVFPGTDSAADRACATISGSTLAVAMRGGQGDKSCDSMLTLDGVVEEELERCHSGVNDISCHGIGQTSCCPWDVGSVRNLATDVSSGKWSGRRCSVRRSRVCESREQEEEAYALQAAVTSGRVKVLVASIAPSVMHGIGVKGFAPPPPPAFFRLCSVWIWWWSVVGTIQRWKRWPGVRKSGGAQPIQGLFLATLSRQARDGMRRPMEPTGARANLSHDLLDAPHRLVFFMKAFDTIRHKSLWNALCAIRNRAAVHQHPEEAISRSTSDSIDRQRE